MIRLTYAGLPRYRVPGGTYFFTINLLERRADLLVRHIIGGRRQVLIHAIGVARVRWMLLPASVADNVVAYHSAEHPCRASALRELFPDAEHRVGMTVFSLTAEASINEEPGAVVLHAGICAGGRVTGVPTAAAS